MTWAREVRVVLAGILLFSATAKIASGHHATHGIPAWAFYTVTACEVGACLLLWTRAGRVVAAAGLVVTGGALIAYWWSGLHWQCGCFGDLQLSRALQLVLLSTMGACFAWLVRGPAEAQMSFRVAGELPRRAATVPKVPR